MNTELETTNESINLLAEKAECGLIKLAYNSEMTILYANNFFYTLHGYTKEEYTELYGSNALARIHPDDAQRFKASVARQLSMGTALRFEYRVIKKDGTISWLSIRGQMTATDQRISYLCSCIDITATKVSYQDLAKSKLELDIISNNTPGGVVKIRSTDFKILYANNSFFDISGYSRLEYEEKFGNITLGPIYHGDLEMVQENVKKTLRDRSPLSIEYRIVHKSGQIRWSYLNASLIEEEDGTLVFLCVIVDISVQKDYLKELELYQQKHQILAELTNERLWEYDISTQTIRRSGNLEYSFSQESVISDSMHYLADKNIIHMDDQNTFHNAFNFKRKDKKNIKVEIRMKNNIGLYNWYRLQGIIMYDDTGTPSQVIGKTIDIDASKQQYLKLQEEANRDNLTQLFNTSALASKTDSLLSAKEPGQESALVLLDLDHFKILTEHYGRLICDTILSQTALIINEAFPGELVGRIDTDQFVVFLPSIESKKEIEEKLQALCNSINSIQIPEKPDLHVSCSIGYFTTKDTNFTFEIMLLRANVALRSIKSKGGNGYEVYGSLKNTLTVASSKDVQSKRNYYDSLTGLYSLPAFIIEGERLISEKIDNKHAAIIYLDINSFKIFNANYGFTVGNKILKYFARVLEEEKQPDEICCHIENDEFACLVFFDNPQELATRFNALKERFQAKNTQIEDYFRFNFTCGACLSTSKNFDIASMIDHANYARKSTKGVTEVSHYAVYNTKLEKEAKKHLEIESSIESALENGEITPYFQPKYSLHTEKLVSIEVLTRWKKHDGSLLLPDDFFPILERNGFIVELDFYIIEQTLRVLKRWMEQNKPLFPVCFNISGSHLKTSNFVERIVELMAQYSVPIEYLELEIAEHVFVKSPEATTLLVEELTDLGFKISLDDFGKTYSAINSLKDLPLYGVKLDTAFFHGRLQNQKERIIFKKVIEMAKELQLLVCSEGVETQLQAKTLKELGCDVVQGFLYHNPMPIGEFEEYILSHLK
ncbi:MAG: EAL domain-containing protein [Lachnospiraceae bacterium]|nr:EAL domain-containing protein [Lachnospiraceae bacterium]